MKRVIITGPTGAIGMALIQKFIDSGIEVLAICRSDSLRKQRLKDNNLLKVIYCSIDDYNSLQNSSNEEYDIFYHLAWKGTTGESRNDMYLQNNNVKFALDALELANRFRCKTFVFAGSQAEYGPMEVELKADTPVNPIIGYGIAKYCAGKMTKIRADQLGIKHIWTRILSVYGPYDGEKSMIMSSIRKMLNGEVTHFTKGEQMWDYLYSGDAAHILYLLGYNMAEGIYCLGSGTVRPLHEYIEVIRDNIDKSIHLGIGDVPYSKNQVMYLCADINNLVEAIGYSPVTCFEDGIKETIEWCKNNK